MKKVKYITRHAISNYGSVLQTYALQKAINKCGFDAECVDYIPRRESVLNLSRFAVNDTGWSDNRIRKIIYYILHTIENIFAELCFNKIRKKYLKLSSKQYKEKEELEREFSVEEKDIVMVGSDQVWNVMPSGDIDSVYFLDFVPDKVKKVAYAASFGSDEYIKEKYSIIQKYLVGFSEITVREDQGVKILKEMGIAGKQVLDPTLLLDREEWRRLVPQRSKKEDYVLIYQLHNNFQFNKYASQFAKERGMKLYRVSAKLHTCIFGGKFIYLPTLEEFLWYINNANYILTDSFHGTVFSILFNKEFYEMIPEHNASRNLSILKLMNLQNRVIETFDDYTIKEKICYQEVNEILEQERKKSFAVLKGMLNYE